MPTKTFSKSQTAQATTLTNFLRKRHEIEEKYHNDLFSLIQDQDDSSEAMQVLTTLTATLARDHQSQSCLLRKLVERLEQLENESEVVHTDYLAKSANLISKLQKSQLKIDDFDSKNSGTNSYKVMQHRKVLERRLRQNVVAFEENRRKHQRQQEKAAELVNDRQSATISCLKSIGQQLDVIARNVISTSRNFNRAVDTIKPFTDEKPLETIEPAYMLKNGIPLKSNIIINHRLANRSSFITYLRRHHHTSSISDPRFWTIRNSWKSRRYLSNPFLNFHQTTMPPSLRNRF